MGSVAQFGRVLLSLAAVLVLMWFIARRFKGSARGSGGALLDVLARRQMSRTSSVAVVRVHDKALILGITDSSIALIGETDLEAAQAAVATAGEKRPQAPRRPVRDVALRLDEDGRIVPADDIPTARPARRGGGLSGSALSPQTWRQTLDSLRDLTARNR